MAINQLAANQVAIQQQMAAMMFTANSPSPHTQFHIPPNPEHGAATFCGSSPGHVQPWARRRRPPAWRTWKRTHRKLWRQARTQSVCTPNAWRTWRYPPICQWPTIGICAPNRNKGECPIPIKPDQKARKLERMLVVWVQRGGWAHVSNMPHPLAQNRPSGGIHMQKCTAVD
jgi:hypothetical protein